MALGRGWTILIGALQGLLLLAAHEAIARGLWPATQWPLVGAWYAAVLGAPVAAQLLAQEGTRRRRLRLIAAQALVLAGLGAYAGYALGDAATARTDGWFIAAFTLVLAWFISLPFTALWMRRGRPLFPYPELFTAAWGNTLTLAFGIGFTGIFWALLGLWAALFDVIGIEFFANLFARREFIYPATTTAFSIAVFLGLGHGGAVITIRKVTLAVLRGLLPLLAVIALLYLACLPFTGLQPLWQTGHAAALLLVTQVLLIVFINGAWQDGQTEEPYAPWLRRLVTAAVVALPVYGGLTLYALFLRVAQHGWTGGRVWAVLLALVTAFHALGYGVAALNWRGRWLAWLAPVNVAGALGAVVLLVAANTPVLDPMRIGAESQLDRLLSGIIPAEEFDFSYLRFNAGRYGIQALQRVAEEKGDPESEPMRVRAREALARQEPWSAPGPESAAQTFSHVTLFPDGKALDPSFVEFMKQQPHWVGCAAPEQDCMLLAADLNGDGIDEYAQLYYPFQLFARGQGGWRAVARIESSSGWDFNALRTALEHGEWHAVRPTWPALQVGDHRFQLVEQNGAP